MGSSGALRGWRKMVILPINPSWLGLVAMDDNGADGGGGRRRQKKMPQDLMPMESLVLVDGVANFREWYMSSGAYTKLPPPSP